MVHSFRKYQGQLLVQFKCLVACIFCNFYMWISWLPGMCVLWQINNNKSKCAECVKWFLLIAKMAWFSDVSLNNLLKSAITSSLQRITKQNWDIFAENNYTIKWSIFNRHEKIKPNNYNTVFVQQSSSQGNKNKKVRYRRQTALQRGQTLAKIGL